jgi:hypothetical protein
MFFAFKAPRAWWARRSEFFGDTSGAVRLDSSEIAGIISDPIRQRWQKTERNMNPRSRLRPRPTTPSGENSTPAGNYDFHK